MTKNKMIGTKITKKKTSSNTKFCTEENLEKALKQVKDGNLSKKARVRFLTFQNKPFSIG